MNTSELDYSLPPELIAQFPAAERDSARMMVLRRGGRRIAHARVSELPEFLEPGDLLVVNDSRVFPARVFGRRPDTGGKAEVLFVEERAGGAWDVMLRTRGAPRRGELLEMAGGAFSLEVLEPPSNGRALVRPPDGGELHLLIERHGVAPLPPYVKRAQHDAEGALRRADLERYQTVYAAARGSIAAPTAGLHFTQRLLERVRGRGAATAALTLHVGPGTFAPIKIDSLAEHRMESERYFLPAAAAAAAKDALARGKRVVAVGTTVVRALESAAAAGAENLNECTGRSELFIYPPFAFKVVNAMLTNFHLPRSTPLAMVCALAGTEFIKEAYAEAIRERYRFYSYGDCMLIL